MGTTDAQPVVTQVSNTPARASAGGRPGLAVSIQLVFAALAVAVIWMLDDWRAVSLDRPDYLYLAAGSLVAVLFPLLVWRGRGALVVPAMMCAFLWLLPRVDTNALKPLLRGADALTLGMDRSQILATINEEFEGTPYAPPIIVSESPDRILLRSRPFPGNSESLAVHLSDAGFVRASFSED